MILQDLRHKFVNTHHGTENLSCAPPKEKHAFLHHKFTVKQFFLAIVSGVDPIRVVGEVIEDRGFPGLQLLPTVPDRVCREVVQ